MNQEDKNNDSFQEIDLKELLGVIFKWKWLIALITLFAVATSGIISYFVLPPVYETKTVLMVTHSSENQRYTAGSDNMESIVNTLSRLPEMTINTYIDQLKNESMLRRVVERLELDKAGYNHRSLSSMISARSIAETNLIEVTITNTDPQLAAVIANALTDEFLKFISEQNRERMGQSVTILHDQIKSIEKDLAEVNDDLRAFNSQARSIIYLEGELSARLADLTAYQSNLIAAKIELDQLLAGQAKLQENLANTSPVIIKETIEEQANSSEKETDAKETNAEIDDIIMVTRITEEPNPNYDNLLQQLKGIDKEVVQQQTKVNSITRVIGELERSIEVLQVELTEKKSDHSTLVRNLDRLERNHELFSERLAQTQIFQSIDIGESSIQVVALATAPTNPVKPNKALNVAIAFVLALMIGVFLAFVLEFFDDNIKNAEDVKKHLDLPVMGSIPKINGNTKSEGK